MKAVKRGTVKAEVEEIAPLLHDLFKKQDGQRIFELFLRYLISTTENISINEYKDIFMEKVNPKVGEYVMTLAEQLIHEGEAKGEAKGKFERTIEIARKMLKEGADKLFIAKITELPLEKIEQLQAQS